MAGSGRQGELPKRIEEWLQQWIDEWRDQHDASHNGQERSIFELRSFIAQVMLDKRPESVDLPRVFADGVRMAIVQFAEFVKGVRRDDPLFLLSLFCFVCAHVQSIHARGLEQRIQKLERKL